MTNAVDRAQGCLLGQLAGDALGGLVEFQTPGQIRQEYPNGVRELADGGTWNTIAGQPTDDSEMALLLARMLADQGRYDSEEAVVDTVMRGGDTDTNAAICGALLGAVWGRNAIPDQWTECVLNCRPAAGQPHVRRPRPECFWPVDALGLAERLLKSGEA